MGPLPGGGSNIGNSEHLLTELLRRWSGGDREPLDEPVPLVYQELHRFAAGYLRAERSDHTLQTTTLVNEVYLRLAGRGTLAWQNRGHFYGVAARILRHILVDHARERDTVKRRGAAHKVPLDRALTVPSPQDLDLVALDRSLDRLAEFDPKKARLVSRVVVLRRYTHAPGCRGAGVSPATAHREWAIARTWLYRNMMAPPDEPRTVARG